MMAGSRPVIRNPALSLRTRPKSGKARATGSREEKQEHKRRFPHYQKNLLSEIQTLIDRFGSLPTHGDRVLLWLNLLREAAAPSHTPYALCSIDGCDLVASWRGGYLAETSEEGLKSLKARVKEARAKQTRIDIANISGIGVFAEALAEEVVRDDRWEASSSDQDGRTWVHAAIAPYRSLDAKDSVYETLRELLVLPEEMVRRAGESPELPVIVQGQGELLTEWKASDKSLATVAVGVTDREQFLQIVLSGSISRWEPISLPKGDGPGGGQEPDTPIPEIDGAPVVGVVDGGYHAQNYRYAISWEAEKLVQDRHADRHHGNVITGLVVDADRWSNRLEIPHLPCRVGIVQAVPSLEHDPEYLDTNTIVENLREAMMEHPETRVWNISANTQYEAHKFDISELGHRLGRVARETDCLLVISSGNRHEDEPRRIAPPADCDPALVVAGRDDGGLLHEVAGPCPISRTAFGPNLMFKPDISWYSRHRVPGGDYGRGSSFAAPLVSRVAAHCFQNLENPTSDLVKALILNAADMPKGKFDERLGYGSPVLFERPWDCPQNMAIIAWAENLKAQTAYRWTGIAIPPSMIVNGRLVGRVRLIAIHKGVISRYGDEYLSTRVQPNVQALNQNKKKWEGILGVSKPDTYEHVARKDELKWQSTKVFDKAFSSTNGPFLGADTLEVVARVFWRHRFQHTPAEITDGSHETTFVLTLESNDKSADTYNEFRQLMGNQVENLTPIEAEVDENIE